jgi:hypothetical protein
VSSFSSIRSQRMYVIATEKGGKKKICNGQDCVSGLHGELHDCVNDIVAVVLEGFDRLAAGHVGLGHHQLDILNIKNI